MKNLYKDIVFSWRSRLSKIGLVISGLGIFLFPLPGSIALGTYFYLQRKYTKKDTLRYLVLVSGILLLISLIILKKEQLSQSILGLLSFLYYHLFRSTNGLSGFMDRITSQTYASDYFWPHVTQWIMGINIFGWSISTLIVTGGLSVQKSSVDILMDETKKDENKRDALLDNRGGICFEDKGHVGAFGMTGSGKTATVLNYIERAIKIGQFTVVLDGKGGITEWDLNTVTEALARKYNRKLYVINQSDISKTNPYNPFLGITETELKDLLSSLTEWSEEHYRNQALTYWQMMGRVLRKVGIPFSFETIIRYSDPNELKSLVETAVENGTISKKLSARCLSVISANRQTVLSAIGRLAIFNDGDGRYLFGEDGFSLRQAYEENAVVVVYLNEFKYSDFARSLGKLVVAEYKLFLSLKNQRKDESEALLVMDELGVYVEDNYEGLLNRTRSYGVKTIICMQVIADIEKVCDKLLKQLLGNLTNFLIMRTDDDTANEVAKFIGTEKQVKRTSRSNEEGNTGESSNNVADEFVLNPNKIKNLDDLEGYYYSHNRPGKPAKFYTTFVNVEDEQDEPEKTENETSKTDTDEAKKNPLISIMRKKRRPEKIIISKKSK